ncbi:Holliday junction resolvase YqgF [Neoasaia chiangmaiensis NBRC 101099]|uniref:Putative pre-16S rRNA nuclease n=1 Tax=Neoasaia chiangmaiensis TaxID=320497 RepID=A0A1U9KND3_9PROT|nr:Holliday junction resolvase RuvX [Neoasaia chiangmaiensis]AQS87314.1 crossover junction endodeoxyribonuclease RuvA [Neoasaia chiangmaiensis]GBR38639.1 Holliday junction resolvase YqgF [Neoasaia chiangmaiensis NBRC 101099]GEN15807.1 putative pre-16S rRNA nuclease [Neoasaia chiangmaiensis]
MPLFNPHELRRAIPAGKRVLGLDPGSKTIGLALTDVSLMLASPYRSIPRKKLGDVATTLAAIVEKEEIGALIAGLPLSLDGSFGPAARAAQDWLTELATRLHLPACTWDERLSSSAVNRFLIQDADMTRKRRAEVVDKMAASYMLQGWLDATVED